MLHSSFPFLSFLKGDAEEASPGYINTEVIINMEKLLTRKEAARLLGISIKTLDSARNNGLVSFVQYCENGSVYFTEHSLQEYVARSTHRAIPKEINKGTTYRNPRNTVRR
jgi:hypothetical protein